ncbi:MAG: hypothetical protein FJY65_05140 [Calditrichaeota bacterium]|nr:hypothetical protein [Calditrichota bacterium]
MSELTTNCLYYGDNLPVLRKYIPTDAIDLIYLDPPFNSKREYNIIFKDRTGRESQAELGAFEDFWRWNEQVQMDYDYLVNTTVNRGLVSAGVSSLIFGLCNSIGRNDITAYLVEMTIRLLEIHRVLKSTGSMYLHCGPSVSHYIKVVCDQIFKPVNFRREITWRSGWVSGFKTSAQNWVRNHDVILYYVKDINRKWTFNKELAYKPHPPDYIRRGETSEASSKGYAIEDVWGAPRGDFDQTEKELWSPWIKSFSREKTPYQTQKPLPLLNRIISVSSRKNDIVLDPFCGCGTTMISACELGRRWIGIDITHLAIAEIKHRMREKFAMEKIPAIGEPKDIEGARQLALEPEPNGRYQFQWWVVSLFEALPMAGTKHKGADKGIDGVIYFQDYSDEDRTSITSKSIVLSVKSGSVSVKDIRDLAGTISRVKDCAMGIFISMQNPTREMTQEALANGFYHSPMWGNLPKIQMITIQDLLDGKHPKIPQALNRNDYNEKKRDPFNLRQSEIKLR